MEQLDQQESKNKIPGDQEEGDKDIADNFEKMNMDFEDEVHH